MSKLDQFKEDFVLLLEAGFIAVNQADEDSAIKLFKAAEQLQPKNILPTIGLGYLHLHKLELTSAIKMFKQALKIEPNNEMAKTFLGIAMTFSSSQLAEGEKLLAETKKELRTKT
jgi:tetratricopeptide (TPR) repeat protein